MKYKIEINPLGNNLCCLVISFSENVFEAPPTPAFLLFWYDIENHFRKHVNSLAGWTKSRQTLTWTIVDGHVWYVPTSVTTVEQWMSKVRRVIAAIRPDAHEE